MTPSEVQTIAAGCTRFLGGHRRRSVQERMREIAESPLALRPPDVYGQGGVVSELEERIAAMLGKEAAVFMPSGTMAQPIALRIWADRAACRRIAFHPTCHLEIHEHKAYRELHGLDAVLLGEADRLFTLEDLEAIDDPISTLLIELPQREIGGQLPAWEDLTAICERARSRGMRLHLDGARLWECAPFYGRSYAEIVAPFDSVYVSFYKVLGGLPGAILAGPKAFVEEARVWQRRQGGNLHQQSPNAIAAEIGLARHLPSMPRYVERAGEFARVLRGFERIRVLPERPPTNMMHLFLDGDPERLVQAAIRIAQEDRVGLFFGLGPGGKTEVWTGEASLELDPQEVESLFAKLFRLAGS